MRFFGAGGKIENNGFPRLGHDLGQSEASWHRYQYLASNLFTASNYNTNVTTTTGGITAYNGIFGMSTMDEKGIIYSARIGLVNGTCQHYQIDTNTETISLFDTGITSTDEYDGIALCATVNGIMYSGAGQNGKYIKIDTKTNPPTVTKKTLPNYTPVPNDSYAPQVVPTRNNQGYVYQCPYGHGVDRIWKLDPYTDTVTEIGINFNPNVSTWGWHSNVLCPQNNCIYGIYLRGLNNNKILKIDTNTDTVSLLNTTLTLPNSNDQAYRGGTYDPVSQKVWFMPISLKFQIVSLDPNNNDSTSTHGTYSGANGPRYIGACLGLDGRIYSIGWAYTNIWTYDIQNNIRTQSGSTGLLNAYLGESAILGKNGKIYLFPFNATTGIGVINTSNNEVYNLPTNYLITNRNSH